MVYVEWRLGELKGTLEIIDNSSVLSDSSENPNLAGVIFCNRQMHQSDWIWDARYYSIIQLK